MKLRKSGMALLLLLACIMLAVTALADSYTTLQYGDSGEDVRRMQQALITLGYKNVTADGKFGAYTENAVRKFQRSNGLAVDGKAGSRTLTLLYAKAGGTTVAPTAPPVTQAPVVTSAPYVPSGGIFGGNYATLRHGSSGDRVKLLQNALNALGYGTLKVDGKFGTGTLTAVMAFQRRNGLSADGAAGKKTLTAIEKALGGGASATPTPQVATPTPMIVTTAPQVTSAPGSYARPTRTLNVGMSGDDVKSLQGRLKELGYYTGAVDGKFGSGTVAAVLAFQRAYGLTADGVAGKKTYDKLYGSTAVPTAAPAPTSAPQQTSAPVPTIAPGDTNVTLKKNSTGLAVMRMQGALALLDYTPNTFGTYDNATAAAVKDFQSRNGLPADGIAGPATLTKLYSGTAVRGTATGGSADGVGAMAAPSVSQLRMLHWYNDIKPSLKSHDLFLIYDPATGLSWKLRLMSAGRHADVEPYTAQDTAIQYRAFGNHHDWGPKPVYVLLPDGRWTVAGLSNVPHNTQTIKDNNYNGQNCLHFLRDMDETQKMDPKTGVANQNTIRTYWQWITGEVIE